MKFAIYEKLVKKQVEILMFNRNNATRPQSPQNGSDPVPVSNYPWQCIVHSQKEYNAMIHYINFLLSVFRGLHINGAAQVGNVLLIPSREDFEKLLQHVSIKIMEYGSREDEGYLVDMTEYLRKRNSSCRRGGVNKSHQNTVDPKEWGQKYGLFKDFSRKKERNLSNFFQDFAEQDIHTVGSKQPGGRVKKRRRRHLHYLHLFKDEENLILNQTYLQELQDPQNVASGNFSSSLTDGSVSLLIGCLENSSPRLPGIPTLYHGLENSISYEPVDPSSPLEILNPDFLQECDTSCGLIAKIRTTEIIRLFDKLGISEEALATRFRNFCQDDWLYGVVDDVVESSNLPRTIQKHYVPGCLNASSA